MILFAILIGSIILAIYVAYKISSHKAKNAEPIQFYREPFSVVNGKVLCIQEYSEHLKTKNQKDENINSTVASIEK